jgi:ABC-type phosphate/phosphonate transport system substrate-binding protein
MAGKALYPVFCKCLFITIALVLTSCDSGNNVVGHDLDDVVDTSKLPQQHIPQQEKNIFYFGFDLRASPQEDARQYLSFLHYLEKKTGYKFKLRFNGKGHSIIDELGQNKIQFASIGAESFIRAHYKYGGYPW